jgi:hypothetical protein
MSLFFFFFLYASSSGRESGFSYSNSPAINSSERRPVACVPEIVPAALVVEVTTGGAGAPVGGVTVPLGGAESLLMTPPETPPGGATLAGASLAAAVKAARVLLELLFLVIKSARDLRGNKRRTGNLHVDHTNHTRLAMLGLCAVEPDGIRSLDINSEGSNLESTRKSD